MKLIRYSEAPNGAGASDDLANQESRCPSRGDMGQPKRLSHFFVRRESPPCDVGHIHDNPVSLIWNLETIMSSSNEQKSGLWKHGLLLTLLFGFTVMIVGGVMTYRSRAPIPDRVAGPNGATLFTASDIQQGQDLFRKRGLMDYGTVLGHGAYLGPDYTAEALHWMTEAMRRERIPNYDALGVGQEAAIDAEIAQELKVNRYASGTLTFTAGQVAGWNIIVDHYYKLVAEGQLERALPKGALLPVAEGGGDPAHDREAARQLGAFVTWTAWLSVAKRPEAAHSYTNNWPFDKAAGNTATAGAMMWSAVSVAALLFFLALILYFQHRYQLSAEDGPNPNFRVELGGMT